MTTDTFTEFFAGHPASRRIFETLYATIQTFGDARLRVSRSQIAFVRRRSFACVWIPGRYLRGHHAPLVLTLSFPHRDSSARWKEIVEAAPGRFTHHLELHTPDDIDEQVRAWLRASWISAA
jgi:hypothetical protein